jgi:hypothetical protein
MSVRVASISLLVFCLALPAFAAGQVSPRREGLSLRLAEPPAQAPFKLDVSGSYGTSPTTIMVRDAVFGAVLGVVGVAGTPYATRANLGLGMGLRMVSP